MMDTECAVTASRALSNGEIQHALESLMDNKNLRLSERNRRFLAFVVGETLVGRAQRIKAYSIGIDVFGRSETFNPAVDPIVRIEATRLRAALSSYYEGPGAFDEIRITLPPGGYIPRFEHRRRIALCGGTEIRSGRKELPPISEDLIVLKHVTDPENRCACRGGELLVDSIALLLSNHGLTLFVMPPPERTAALETIKRLLHKPAHGYALDIAVHTLADRQRYSWCMTELQNGRIKYVDHRDQHGEGLPIAGVIDDMADDVVKSLIKHV